MKIRMNFLPRTATTLLFAAMTMATAWAQTWTEVGTKETLNAAIADGAHIRLTSDIALSDYLGIGQSATQTVTIDLNGHILKRSNASFPEDGGNVIEVFNKGTLTLEGGTLTGGFANSGGGIHNDGTLTLNNVTITACKALYGGGIMNEKGAFLSINGGSITNCFGSAGGGAMVNHGIADISGCTMSKNITYKNGGAVWSDNTLTVSNSTFNDNEAIVEEIDGVGGAVYLNDGTNTLTNVTITDNKSLDGAALYVASNAKLSICGNSILSGNNSSIYGGGGITNNGTVALKGEVIITNNTCKAYGGGVWNNGTLSMEGNIQIKANEGDDIYLKKGKVINVTGALTGGEGSIGVRMEDFCGVFTKGYADSKTITIPFVAYNINKVSVVEGECNQLLGFYECSWDEEKKQVVHTNKVVSPDIPVHNICTDIYANGGSLNGSRWFVAHGKGSMANSLSCLSGDFHLILCDDAEINIKNGIFVPEDASFHIYCQSYGEHMGKLIVDSSEEDYFAGIGARDEEPTGRIIIHGGNINAKAGEDAAGIGGGDEDDAGFKEITIYDGIIYAEGGENATGIGYGDDNTQYGTINIYGGTIEARGGDDAAGIGGSEGQRDAFTNLYKGDIIINIHGGNIKAYGGYKGAGLGCGRGYRWSKVNIFGGDISAWGGDYAPGIGCGYKGNVLSSDGNYVNIHGGITRAYGGKYAAGVGGGQEDGGSMVTVNGGSLYAYGGMDAAGIGTGEANTESVRGGTLIVNGGYVYAEGTSWGAGIGGGEDAAGAYVTINGGIVEARAGEDAANKNGCAIGSEDGEGRQGKLEIAEWMMVSAGGSPENIERTFTAGERVNACFYRPFARIEPCEHTGATVTIDDADTHTAYGCNYCLMNGNRQNHVFGDYGECHACHLVSLVDDKDNTEVVKHWRGKAKPVALTDRKLHKDGSWNTLCLPFDVDDFNGTPLEGATVMTLDNASYENGTLTIKFYDPKRINAGKPYLIKWNNDKEHPVINNPVFTGVTISDVSPDDKAVATYLVTFQGQYTPLDFDKDGDKTLLYLGDDNKLLYPNGDATINAFRAWLKANINYGDVNNDEMVSVSDVTCLVNHILGNQDDNFDIKKADLNGDGTISVNDVTTLVDIILQGSGILNVVVTGADGLTFGGVGNGPARISTYPHYE